MKTTLAAAGLLLCAAAGFVQPAAAQMPDPAQQAEATFNQEARRITRARWFLQTASDIMRCGLRDPAWGRAVQSQSAAVIDSGIRRLATLYPDDQRTAIIYQEVALTLRSLRVGFHALSCDGLQAHPETMRAVDEAQSRGIR